MIDRIQNKVIKSEIYYGQESQNLLNYKFLLENWPGKKVTLQRNIYVYDYTLSVNVVFGSALKLKKHKNQILIIKANEMHYFSKLLHVSYRSSVWNM